MNSDLKAVNFFCPRCGSPIDENDMCSNDDCWYVLISHNIIDISFKSKGIAKALSNLCNYPFTFDGISCQSMESFIQSLRIPIPQVQSETCSMSGPFCYSIRDTLPDWRYKQTVYWKGREIDRHSKEYAALINSAYKELYCQSALFKYALEQSKGKTLMHSIGCADDRETLLTPEEYLLNLNYLRDK